MKPKLHIIDMRVVQKILFYKEWNVDCDIFCTLSLDDIIRGIVY